MSKTLFGFTKITLDGEDYELVPTLAAVRSIEAHFGGLRGASQALNSLSVSGCAVIIAAGAGLSGKAADEVAESVWQVGVVDVAVALNAYLTALYNPRGKTEGKSQAPKG
jgi:hypothetical protein